MTDGPNAQVESYYVPSVFLVKLSHPNVWKNKDINVRLTIVSWLSAFFAVLKPRRVMDGLNAQVRCTFSILSKFEPSKSVE